MSDLLVQLQEKLSQYPTWAVAGAVGFLVVVLAVLLWKAMKVVITALIIALVVAIGWFAWEHFTGDKGTAAPASQSSGP